jgi:multiple sugar transport system substrate-binding protein
MLIGIISWVHATGTTEQKSISVIVEAGSPAHTVTEKTAAEFEKISGYKVNIVPVPYSGLYDKIFVELKSPTGAYDVGIIDFVWIPSFAQNLVPVSELINSNVRKDIFDVTLQSCTYQGEIYGMPLYDQAQVLVYRKDLFNDSKEQADFKSQYGYSLKVPETFKDYRDVAKFFTREGLYGTALEGATHESTACVFYNFALEAGAKDLVWDNKGNVIIDSQPYVDALRLERQLVLEDKSVPPAVFELPTYETAQLFKQGKLAMCTMWTALYPTMLDPKESKVATNVGVAPNLAGTAGIGVTSAAWAYAIPKSSKKQEAAKKYLEYMFNAGSKVMDIAGLTCRKTIFQDYANKPGFEWVGALAASLGGPQSKVRPMQVKYLKVSDSVIVPMIQSVLAEKRTPEEAVVWAKTEIQKIMKE